MTRIFIENQELDLTKDFSQQTTYAVDDLNNLDSKSTSFTKTIVLPGTANNNRLLGNIFEFNNSNFTGDFSANVGYNFNASKSAQARMEINGLQVMKGVLRLLEIIIDGDYIEYEVALFGELGGFFSSMSSRKLTDLDFSEYDHQYSATNIQNSWNAASGGTGYYYPLIDYGTVSPTFTDIFKRDYYFTAFRPAFFVKQYMEKIIEQAGYTYQSTFFNTDFFKRLIIPNNQSRLLYKSNIQFASRPFLSFQTISGNVDIEQRDAQTTVFTDVNSNEVLWRYTADENLTCQLNINARGFYSVSAPSSAPGTFGEAFAKIQFFKNGTEVIYEKTKIGGRIGAYGANTAPRISYAFNTSFSIDPIIEFNLVKLDTIEMVASIDYVNSNENLVLELSITSGSLTIKSANEVFIPANYNDNLIVNGTLPANILQKDFFTSILKLFNLMVTEDIDTEKKLIIEPYVDFYDTDKSSYLDWSDKVDKSKPIKVKPMSEINARYYEFKYKSDSDYYNDLYKKKYSEEYGNRTFDNQLEFAKDKDNTEVIFAPTPLVKYANRDKAVSAIYKINNGVEQMTEHTIRILQAKKITGVTSWQIRNQDFSSIVSGLTSYGYAGHVDNPSNPQSDLSFGAPKEIFFNFSTGTLSNNLFNVYYSPYFAEITDKDSRLITCKMKLNEQDIFNLNFGKFIYIDGTLYRLIKISDFTEDDVCEVQLLRVINTLY
jgi:hypothetical protein